MAAIVRRPLTDKDKATIEAMYRQHKSAAAIAKAIGRAQGVVYRALRAFKPAGPAKTKARAKAPRKATAPASYARIGTADASPDVELKRLRALVERLATRYPKILIEIL